MSILVVNIVIIATMAIGAIVGAGFKGYNTNYVMIKNVLTKTTVKSVTQKTAAKVSKEIIKDTVNATVANLTVQGVIGVAKDIIESSSKEQYKGTVKCSG